MLFTNRGELIKCGLFSDLTLRKHWRLLTMTCPAGNSERGFRLTRSRATRLFNHRPSKACYPKDTLRHSLAPADTILWRRTANAFRKDLIRDVLKQC